MEVGSESGVIALRDPFGASAVPKPPAATAAQQSSPSVHSMRLSFASDSSTIYKPMANPTSYQPVGSVAPATAAATTAATPTSVAIGSPVTLPFQGMNANTGSDSMKRKRGRPRKYGPDGSMALALTPSTSPPVVSFSPTSGGFSPLSVIGGASMDSGKKKGRPAGFSKQQQQQEALGPAGIGFTPHVITVKAGEDVSSKIMSFSQNGPRAVCVLSANGAVSNVTLRQAATSGGTVTYEGRFEILSLSGSYLLSEIGGQRSRTGGLSVSLAGPDGKVLGGGVAGLLTAASPVQVVVGSFIAEGQKETKRAAPMDSGRLAPGLLPSGMTLTGGSSPPSRGTHSESSGGGTGGSPPHHPSNNTGAVHEHGVSSMPWRH